MKMYDSKVDKVCRSNKMRDWKWVDKRFFIKRVQKRTWINNSNKREKNEKARYVNNFTSLVGR